MEKIYKNELQDTLPPVFGKEASLLSCATILVRVFLY